MAELIVALDFPDSRTALALASSLKGLVSYFKVGLELFTAEGPAIVRELKKQDFRVFLDLKLYDIPNTVAHAVRSARNLGVDMLTVHCQGGQRMCEAALAAVQTGAPRKPLILGVTVLTSFTDGDLPGLSIPASQYALELARLANQWALPGLVCSGLEAAKIKSLYPEMLCLCPGIRPAAHEAGDQRRTVTPAEAVRAGADFLVVGRPVSQSEDPARAAGAILEEMREASA